MPNVWLPLVWGESAPRFDNLEHSLRILSLILQLQNTTMKAIQEGSYTPHLSKALLPGTENRAQPWSLGFVLGVTLDDDWKRSIADKREQMMVMRTSPRSHQSPRKSKRR